jgi:hypothetical protein
LSESGRKSAKGQDALFETDLQRRRLQGIRERKLLGRNCILQIRSLTLAGTLAINEILALPESWCRHGPAAFAVAGNRQVRGLKYRSCTLHFQAAALTAGRPKKDLQS